MTFLGMPMPTKDLQLRSDIDHSANFVTPFGPRQALEARFVRRGPGYIVVYISPQTGCAQACRFCHLTASGQVKGRDATVAEVIDQATTVLDYFDAEQTAGRQAPAPAVHFNFMARGEPLASSTLLEHGDEVMAALFDLARQRRMLPSVKISTIGPKPLDRSLLDVFPVLQPDLYYSLYSLDPAFRRRWLPNAADPHEFLDELASWQRLTRNIPVLHHAMIAGENDDISVAHDIVAAVNTRRLRADVNIVRYNPPSPRHGVEASDESLKAHQGVYAAAWPAAKVRVIERVGFDVAASCGMFVGGNTPAGAGGL
jgi:23S rRNA (adenine2503-C2)-methyltransferase